MPMPRWWGHVNKRVFNPRAISSGKWPVLTHVGRTSGTTYRTPLDAYPVEGGYVFILVYGSGSDWVQNVLKAGSARLSSTRRRCALAPRASSRKTKHFKHFPQMCPNPRDCSASPSTFGWI